MSHKLLIYGLDARELASEWAAMWLTLCEFGVTIGVYTSAVLPVFLHLI